MEKTKWRRASSVVFHEYAYGPSTTATAGVPRQAPGGEERDEALAPARERAEDEGG